MSTKSNIIEIACFRDTWSFYVHFLETYSYRS